MSDADDDRDRAERLEAAVVAHTYGLMPTAMLGVATTSFAFMAGAVGSLRDRRVWIFTAVQFFALFVNVAILVAYRRGGLASRTSRARAAQRFGVLVAGIAWGVAGVLWPIEVAEGAGFALAFCYAGMCAGGATTLAGDPIAYGIFATTAVLPDALLALPTASWIAALMLVFVVLTSYTVVVNSRTLRESLSLRFENDALLRRAVREREAAEHAAFAKTRFLAAASHDLRQPVQALSLFADVAQGFGAMDEASRGRTIRAIARTTEALRAMIEGLLDISRLDAGIVPSKPKAVALRPLLGDVVTALVDEAEANDMVLVVGGPPATVLADPALLSRVLHNLAANAVRHARRGRVLLAIRRRGARAVVQVWDQGQGIDATDRDRIFEEFVQLGNRERDRRKGLGLGLPIVRRICELNGWELTLRSTPGRGSMFAVAVPIAESSRDGTTRAGRARLDGIRVLLVEDDVLVREATVAFLEARGSKVHVADDANAALGARERLRAETSGVEVVVADHRLPGTVSGATLVGMLTREHDAPRAALLLSGDAELPRIDSTASTEVLVLRKPISGDELCEAILRAVATERRPFATRS